MQGTVAQPPHILSRDELCIRGRVTAADFTRQVHFGGFPQPFAPPKHPLAE